MTCRRCGDTGVLVDQVCTPVYEWPPVRCEVTRIGDATVVTCHEALVKDWVPYYEEYRPCPDCRDEPIEWDLECKDVSLEELGVDIPA